MTIPSFKAYTKQTHEINFWFIVLFSLDRAKSNSGMSQAFLINAVVMIALTIESLLNNLADEYLPDEDYERLVLNRSETGERLKKIIRALGGAEGVKEKKDIRKESVKIESNEIGDFFNMSHGDWCWSDITRIFSLRDDYAHYKAGTEEAPLEQTGPTNYRILPTTDRLDYEQVAKYVERAEAFFQALYRLFGTSINSKSAEKMLRATFDFPEHARRNLVSFEKGTGVRHLQCALTSPSWGIFDKIRSVMKIFIDESGDLGFSAGSSKWFVITIFRKRL